MRHSRTLTVLLWLTFEAHLQSAADYDPPGICALRGVSGNSAGGGLLNAYGRSIDEAQSLRGGEYNPTTNAVICAFSWNGRITEDLRFVGQEQVSTSTNAPVLGLFQGRFFYRNATEFGGGVRFSATITAENESAARPALPYEPAVRPTQVYVTIALFSWRVRQNPEFAAGRDHLPGV